MSDSKKIDQTPQDMIFHKLIEKIKEDEYFTEDMVKMIDEEIRSRQLKSRSTIIKILEQREE